VSSYGFGAAGGSGGGASLGFGTSGGGTGGGGGHSGWLGSIVHDVASPFEHLATDIGSAAINLPVGLYQLGKTAIEHPSQLPALAKGIVKQYEDYYGHDVLNHLYQHPLQPILDGLTVLDLGSTGAVAAARALGDVGEAGSTAAKIASLGQRGEIVTRSPKAIETGKGPVVTRYTATRPITKMRQLATQKVQSAFDDWHQTQRPMGGGKRGSGLRPIEQRQWGKEIQRRETQLATARLQPLRGYEKYWNKLSGDERVALSARSLGIHPEDLSEYWQGTENGKNLTPEVQKLMEEPSAKMQVAENHARSLSASGAELLKLRGALSQESELDRPGRFREQAAENLGRDLKPFDAEPFYIPHTTDPVTGSHPMNFVGGGKAEPRDLGTTKQNLGQLFSEGKLDLKNDVLGPEFARRVKWLKFHGIHEALKRGAPRMTYDELMTHYGGRAPKGWDYLRTSVPMTEKGQLLQRITRLERIQARRPTPERDALIKDLYTKRAPYVLGEKPDKFVGMAKQKIPFSIRGEGEYPMGLHQLIPNPEDLQDSALAKHGFTTDTIHDAVHDGQGRYFLIPKAASKAATGEFTRMSDFMYRFGRQPVRIWRSLILGLRPAFLVNNLLGNSLMYAIKTGGRGAVRDLYHAIRETWGDHAAAKVLADPSTPSWFKAEQSFTARNYPEQLAGTFGRTQSPSTEGLLRGYHSAAGQKFQTATGWLPHITSKVAEEVPRRALVRNMIRNSPEFKQVWGELPRESRTFEKAAQILHEGAGSARFQRMISDQVDNSIGNYTHMNQLERGVLRSVLPFYSWYRAIVQTTAHLAVDTPLRAQLLFKLGQIGAEAAAGNAGLLALPSYLQGAIPLGTGPMGTERLLSTQSLNPWATLGQLSRGLTSDITSLGIDPYMQGLMTSFAKIANAPNRAGGAQNVSPGALLGDMLSSIGLALPPVAQLFPKGPSKLYPTRGVGGRLAPSRYENALLSWLGVPIKEADPAVAAQQAAIGR